MPGYTGSKEDFAPLLAPLAAAGFAATAIDLPGQYESPGPADPAGYTPDAARRAVLRGRRVDRRARCTCSGTRSAAWSRGPR